MASAHFERVTATYLLRVRPDLPGLVAGRRVRIEAIYTTADGGAFGGRGARSRGLLLLDSVALGVLLAVLGKQPLLTIAKVEFPPVDPRAKRWRGHLQGLSITKIKRGGAAREDRSKAFADTGYFGRRTGNGTEGFLA